MEFLDFAIAVFIGNAMTLWFGWGLFQFHRHDYRAPWSAYGAVLVPVFIGLGTLFVTGPLPPHLDALAPLLSAEIGQ